MINIYPPNAEDFSTLGLAALQPAECTIEEKAGGMLELNMKHPVDGDMKWTYLQNGCIIKAIQRNHINIASFKNHSQISSVSAVSILLRNLICIIR